MSRPDMQPTPSRAGRWAMICILFMVGLGWGRPVQAQDSMRLTDDETTVRSVRFRFVGDHFFDPDQLAPQMVTTGPDLGDRLRDWFDFIPYVDPPAHLLDPIELQRDMVRLRRFYVRNGFLNPKIDYPASQFRRSRNAISVIVTVDEGPALTVASREVRSDIPIPMELRRGWGRLVSRAGLKPGERYTDFERLQLEADLGAWLQDRGFAFASVATDLRIDSLSSRVDLELLARLGASAVIDSIRVEGNRSVGDGIVLRELPFQIGDPFRGGGLAKGQRLLAGLGLFRVALVDLPEQSADSLVTVRVRLREAPYRKEALQTGYSREVGATFGASWKHRNFLGDARQLTLSASAQSGLLARPPVGRSPVRQYAGSVFINQPFFFRHNLSASISLNGTTLDDPNLQTRYRQIGVTPALVFAVLPFRTVSVQYAFTRAEPLSQSTSLRSLGIFNQDVITASFTAGRLDNYLNPRKGWMISPLAELAGAAVTTDVAYVKASVDAVGYIPLTRRSSIALSLSLGRLSPRGPSRNQFDPNNEFRFDRIRFYAGGANDVRGWGLNSIGPQIARADSAVANADGSFSAPGAKYEAIGGLGKLAGSIEIWVPAPFLGPSWRTEAFLDFGGVSSRLIRDSEGRAQVDQDQQPLVDDRTFPTLADLKWAAGAGLSLQTPVGAIRFDLAYKLNPAGDDLHDPSEVFLFDQALAGTPSSPFKRRFNFHLSIRRAF
jgi:outer membrane protein insertion porin family